MANNLISNFPIKDYWEEELRNHTYKKESLYLLRLKSIFLL